MFSDSSLTMMKTGLLLTLASFLAVCINSGSTDDSLEVSKEQNLCPYMHPQMQFCSSDFVIRAELRKIVYEKFNNVTGEHERKMKFKLTKVYKAPSSYASAAWPPRPLMRIHVYDIPMTVKQEYLLAGSGTEDLHVHRCDWVTPWNNVTRMQYRGLETRYFDNCRCMIENKCLTADGTNLCSDGMRNGVSKWDKLLEEERKNVFNCPTDMFRSSQTLFECYNEHAACYLTSSGRSCRWRTDDEYYTYCANRDWLRKFTAFN